MSPVDRVVVAYNLLLAVVWALAWWHSPVRAAAGWWAALAHLSLATVPWVVDTRRGRLTAQIASLAALIVDIYPLLVLLGTWAELGPLIAILYRHSYDRVDLWLDQLIFGTHWHLRWFAGMPWPWLAEIMYGAYLSLYPLIIGVPLIFLATRDRPALRDYVFSMTLTHLVCFAIYLGFPVLGPWQFGSHGHVPVGLFFSLNAAVQQAGDSLGTACPSTHVAGSATVALVAWRRLPRPQAIILTIDAALIGLATVYTQNHYAFDVLSGLVVVLVLQGAAAPILMGRRLALPRFTMKRVAIQPLAEGPLG
jgi:membrane-associated phospholipid phosphatase